MKRLLPTIDLGGPDVIDLFEGKGEELQLIEVAEVTPSVEADLAEPPPLFCRACSSLVSTH